MDMSQAHIHQQQLQQQQQQQKREQLVVLANTNNDKKYSAHRQTNKVPNSTRQKKKRKKKKKEKAFFYDALFHLVPFRYCRTNCVLNTARKIERESERTFTCFLPSFLPFFVLPPALNSFSSSSFLPFTLFIPFLFLPLLVFFTSQIPLAT